MFLELESEGITVKVNPEIEEIWKGSIANISADNLGLHQMIGNFFCI